MKVPHDCSQSFHRNSLSLSTTNGMELISYVNYESPAVTSWLASTIVNCLSPLIHLCQKKFKLFSDVTFICVKKRSDFDWIFSTDIWPGIGTRLTPFYRLLDDMRNVNSHSTSLIQASPLSCMPHTLIFNLWWNNGNWKTWRQNGWGRWNLEGW